MQSTLSKYTCGSTSPLIQSENCCSLALSGIMQSNQQTPSTQSPPPPPLPSLLTPPLPMLQWAADKITVPHLEFFNLLDITLQQERVDG